MKKTKINYQPLLDALKVYAQRKQNVDAYRNRVEYETSQYNRLPEKAEWARRRAEKAIGEFWRKREIADAEALDAQHAAGLDAFLTDARKWLGQALDALEQASTQCLEAVLLLAPQLGWEIVPVESYPVHEFGLAVITADGKTAQDFLVYADGVRRARQIKRETSRASLTAVTLPGHANEKGFWVLRETFVQALKDVDGAHDYLYAQEYPLSGGIAVKPLRDLLKLLDCGVLTVQVDGEYGGLILRYQTHKDAKSNSRFKFQNVKIKAGQVILPLVLEER